MKTAAEIELIFCSLYEKPEADGFTHPLYKLVHTDESNWARDHGLLHTCSMRTSKQDPSILYNPVNWRGQAYPRRFYVSILEENHVSMADLRLELLERIKTVS